MSSLADLQREFARALRDPGLPAPPPVHLPPGRASSRRFDVYRNNVVSSLIDALKSTFPAVHRLVGDEYFAAAARAYIDRHPPRSPVLLLYGESFGRFLDRFPSASRVPYLGDVARLEWARVKAFHAPDAAPAGIQALAAIPETEIETVSLALHPSLSLVGSRWPVVSLWSASVDAAGSEDVDMDAPQDAAVLRPALTVRVHPLPPGGLAFLAALEESAPLGEAVQRALDTTAEFELAAQLRFVFDMGAVAGVIPPGQEQS